MKSKAYLTLGDVARQLGVSTQILRYWCEREWIDYTIEIHGGRRFFTFTTKDVKLFLNKVKKGKVPLRRHGNVKYQPIDPQKLRAQLEQATTKMQRRRLLGEIERYLGEIKAARKKKSVLRREGEAS